jgi:hypothetical protein
MEAPLLIRTNHLYRPQAFAVIGGYQDSIIEDHLTSMPMYSTTNPLAGNRFKGVYTPDILAVGEGPTSLTDYFSQQKRWGMAGLGLLLICAPVYMSAAVAFLTGRNPRLLGHRQRKTHQRRHPRHLPPTPLVARRIPHPAGGLRRPRTWRFVPDSDLLAVRDRRHLRGPADHPCPHAMASTTGPSGTLHIPGAGWEVNDGRPIVGPPHGTSPHLSPGLRSAVGVQSGQVDD